LTKLNYSGTIQIHMKHWIPFLTLPILCWALPYETSFVGFKDEAALKSLFDVSETVTLQERPPASLNGLRYRVKGDVPALLKVLRAYGYYDATVTTEVEENDERAQVYFFIRPGTQYKIGSYAVYHKDCNELYQNSACSPLTPELLGIPVGSPALSTLIVNAELDLLTQLSKCGYPLAAVKKRKVVVDMADKTVEAATCLDEGPLTKFGPITVSGLNEVKSKLIMEKVAWTEGELYNSNSIEETQKKLLNTNLFSSVMITHGNKVDAVGEIPIKMKVSEAKHRQISLGVFYATVDGPGVSFHWTHRNVRGMGEIFSIDGDFSERFLGGKATYRINDFLKFDQILRTIGEISREDISAYTAFNYGFSSSLDRKFGGQKTLSIGFEVKHYNISDSASNGTYLLATFPFQGKWSNADDLMNPSRGMTLVYQMLPYQSLDSSRERFIKQRLTATLYLPLWSRRLIFASRFQIGSIAGAKREEIPLSEMFLGGSEDDLRGYKYKTVSPLNEKNKPLGGRSAIFISFEPRIRLTETIGIVPFIDLGSVSLNEFPTIHGQWLQSIGIGGRYYTFFGPLRFDVGFPLDRRPGIDPAYRIYASIGQTF
jgi:translocation and assembly module TamA